MSYRLVVRRRAENHITLAYEWYELQNKNLGSEFLEAIELTLQLIQNNPLMF